MPQNQNFGFDHNSDYQSYGNPFADDYRPIDSGSHSRPVDAPPVQSGWQPDNAQHGTGGWDEWNNAASFDSPPAARISRDQDRPRWNRVSMRAVAMGASVLALIGGGAAAYRALPSVQAQAVEAGPTNTDDILVNLDAQPLPLAIPERVRGDFESALAVDECAVKVSVDEAVASYDRLFGVQERGDLSLENLTDRTNQAIAELQQAREAAGFIPLPASFDNLKQDMEGVQDIPLSEYKAEAESYLARFGVRTIFDTSQAVPDERVDADALSRVRNKVVPISDAEAEEGKVMRKRIISVMNAFSMMPPGIVRHADESGQQVLRAVAFGDVLFEVRQNEQAGGLSFGDTGVIAIDVTEKEELFESTPSHEFGHAVARVCGETFEFIMNNGQRERRYADPAFSSLAGGLVYDETNRDLLDSGGILEGRLGTLYTKDPHAQAVTPDGYAATEPSEHIASDIGELMFYAPGAATIFESQADTTHLREQLALWSARLNHIDPKSADYYAKLMSVAQLQKIVRGERLSPIDQRLFELNSERYAVGGRGNTVIDAESNALREQKEPYDELRRRLQVAVGAPG